MTRDALFCLGKYLFAHAHSSTCRRETSCMCCCGERTSAGVSCCCRRRRRGRSRACRRGKRCRSCRTRWVDPRWTTRQPKVGCVNTGPAARQPPLPFRHVKVSMFDAVLLACRQGPAVRHPRFSIHLQQASQVHHLPSPSSCLLTTGTPDCSPLSCSSLLPAELSHPAAR